ncbi:unnamed protein product, partial [Heterotrigona itama]
IWLLKVNEKYCEIILLNLSASQRALCFPIYSSSELGIYLLVLLAQPKLSERLKSDKLHAWITDVRDIWLRNHLGRDPFSAVSELETTSVRQPTADYYYDRVLSQGQREGERSQEKGSKGLGPSEDFGQKRRRRTPGPSRPNEKSPVTQGNLLPRTLDPFIELTRMPEAFPELTL